MNNASRSVVILLTTTISYFTAVPPTFSQPIRKITIENDWRTGNPDVPFYKLVGNIDKNYILALEDNIIKEFEIKKQIINDFFSSEPLMIAVIKDKDKIEVEVEKNVGIITDFDIQKSGSILKPYTSYIVVNFKTLDCEKLNNILYYSPKEKYGLVRFSSEEEALNVAEKCNSWINTSQYLLTNSLTFIFEYYEDKWHIKNIVWNINNRSLEPKFIRLTMPNGNYNGIEAPKNEKLLEINNKWQVFLQNLL